MSRWIEHVKKYARDNCTTYSRALTESRKSYNAQPAKGGSLSSTSLKGLLEASYDGRSSVGDFKIDKSLSTVNTKVYHDSKTGQTVVAHKGTVGASDWLNNATYALGGRQAYKMTTRYRDAEKVQRKAEARYGKKTITTIGHSQGGLQAELLGSDTKETITLDKATRPFGNKRSKNQIDVSSKTDVVSSLNPFQKSNKKEITIKSNTLNPVSSHDIGQLDKLGDSMIGKGCCNRRNCRF
jgi:hypothetical protein